MVIIEIASPNVPLHHLSFHYIRVLLLSFGEWEYRSAIIHDWWFTREGPTRENRHSRRRKALAPYDLLIREIAQRLPWTKELPIDIFTILFFNSQRWHRESMRNDPQIYTARVMKSHAKRRRSKNSINAVSSRGEARAARYVQVCMYVCVFFPLARTRGCP